MIDHKEQVQQAVLHILNELDVDQATKLLDTTLGYMLEVFKAPEVNDETIDLAVYLLQDNVEHFTTDNFQDLPDELYPLAILRTLGVKLYNKAVINPDNMKYFSEFHKRYQKFIVGKLTREKQVVLADSEWYDTRQQHKDKLASIQQAKLQGQTATQWRNAWLQTRALHTKS
jgi:hypothetical protein